MSASERRSRFPAARPLSGGRAGDAQVSIVERSVALVQFTARKGRQEDLAAALGLDLPPPGRFASDAGRTVLWLQPGSWLISAPAKQRDSLPASLRQSLDGIAAVVDQSHGRSLIELSGASARAVLARLCRLDLDERVFTAGHSAATLVGHVSCLLYRSEASPPCFGLIVGSTFAEWLLDALQAAAASEGWRFEPATEAAA